MFKSNFNLGNNNSYLIDMLRQSKQQIKTELKETAKTVINDAQATVKLNQIMSDFSKGNTTLDETLSELTKLGITPNVTEDSDKTTITFEFNGKNYTIAQNKTAAETPVPNEPKSEEPPLEEPAVEPQVQEPVVEEPIIEPPAVEEPPVVEEPVVEEPEEPAVEETQETEGPARARRAPAATVDYEAKAKEQGLIVFTEEVAKKFPDGTYNVPKDYDGTRHVAIDKDGMFYDYNAEKGEYVSRGCDVGSIMHIINTMSENNEGDFNVQDIMCTINRMAADMDAVKAAISVFFDNNISHQDLVISDKNLNRNEKQEVENKIITILYTLGAEGAEIYPDDNMYVLNLHNNNDIIPALEQEFDISLKDFEIWDNTTVQELVDAVYEKLLQKKLKNDNIQIIQDQVLPESSSYNENYLKSKFSDKDIELFFKKDEEGKYKFNSDAIKACFGKEVESVGQLIDAMQIDGYSEGYVRGAYSFSQEQVEKYLVLVNNDPKRYVLNADAVKSDFPDKDINTLGQLKEAIANGVTSTTTTPTNPTNEGETYTKEYLTATCQFTSRDLSLYFTNKGDKYALNQSFIKSILPNSNIQTVQDLVNALKDASYTEGYVMGLFGFTAQQTAEFFTVTGEGTNKQYTLNQTALKEAFPDKDIRTLGQLREAINNSTDKFDDDLNAPTYAEGILRGALGLSAAIVSEYFRKQSDGTYKLDQSVVKKRFPNDTITTAEELRDAIRAHKTVFTSKGELMGRFGLSAFLVENFFKENADGTYSYDLEKMKYYFRDNQIPYTIENLKNADLYRSFWNQNYTKDSGYDVYAWAEFDSNVSGDELKKYLDAFRNVLTTRYKEMYGFDDEYINKAFDTIFTQMNINNNSDYYLRDVIGKFENDFYSYTRGGWGEWFDGLTPEEMPKTYSSYGLTSKEMTNWIMNNVNSSDPREQYQAKIFMDKFNELGLTGDEVYAFMDMLWRELAEKLGVTNTDIDTGNVRINLYDMAKLDENNDYSVLYELYKIINEKSENIHSMSAEEIQAATSIDTNELFKDSNFLNAEYVEEHLSEMLLSNDPGVRKFANQIYELLLKPTYWYYDENGGGRGYDNLKAFFREHPDEEPTVEYDRSYTKKETLERIKWLITLLNNECGVSNPTECPNTTNVGLTPELLDKLGNNVFDKVQEVINSKKFENCILADVDGIIGDVVQHGGTYGTNDCWLLAGAIAINSTPSGKELFKNAIKWNDDYTAVIVTYPSHPEKPVTIPVEELLQIDADLGGSAISNTGDNDFLVLAIAYEKIFDEDVSVAGNGKGVVATAAEVTGRLMTATMKYSDSFLEKFLPAGTIVTDHHVSAFEVLMDAAIEAAEQTSGIAGGVGGALPGIISGDPISAAIGGALGFSLGGLLGGIFGSTKDNKLEMDSDEVLEYLTQIANTKSYGYNVAATFSIAAVDSYNYSCKTIDGKTWTYNDFIAAHVMAIVDMNPVYNSDGSIDVARSTITFTNTEEGGSSHKYTATWSEFAKLGIAEISWATWSEKL